jgi:DNA mismatch endonuclease (patch repair protein)
MRHLKSTANLKFQKVARLEARTGSAGDRILCGYLPNGAEVLITPERDRSMGPNQFVMMIRGNLAVANDRTFLGLQNVSDQSPDRLAAWQGRRAGTTIETKIRNILANAGIASTEQVADLPGRPDFLIADLHAVIMVHGCFWHAHGCASANRPPLFGERSLKISQATERDPVVLERLLQLGMRVLVVWECAIAGDCALSELSLREACEEFLTGTAQLQEIGGLDVPSRA